MTKMFLNLTKIPKPDDAADALAIAICYTHWANGVSSKFNEENRI
jgi:crossover junction endodeoxyribonuclease RuvC